MKTLTISLMDRPGKSIEWSIITRAERALELGHISKLPIYRTEYREKSAAWVILLDVPESDWKFWFGFYLGMDFHRQNCINSGLIE